MIQRPIPRIRELPLIGSVFDFRFDRLHLFLRTYHECGEIGLFRFGPWSIVLCNTPQYACAVLVEQAERVQRVPRLKRFLDPMIGNGLLQSDHTFHRRQRKLVAPAFQHRRILSYADVMTTYAEESWQTWTDGTIIDLDQEMMRLTLRIVGKTLFDTDVKGDADGFGQALTTAMNVIVEQATALWSPPLSWPTMRNIQLRRAVSHLDRLVYRVINERRQTGKDCGDALSMLLATKDEAGNVLSDQHVRDEVMTLFLAGHETTANALTWTWYLLTQHPHIYAQMTSEVDQVLAGRTPTYADLASLPYTFQVLKEALRVYPPVYIIARIAMHPVTIGDYTLRPGMNIGVSPYVLHRNPTYFPDPERFDPERWTPENEAKLPRYAYLPFGAGPHICIGNHFAMMEAHLILATLTQHVTFELVQGQTIEPEPLITLRPKGGVRVVVRRR